MMQYFTTIHTRSFCLVAQTISSGFTCRELLGEGAAGEVRGALWNGNECAVKIFLDAPRGKRRTSSGVQSATRDWYTELNVMHRLRHPNIVGFFGALLPGDKGSSSNLGSTDPHNTDGSYLRPSALPVRFYRHHLAEYSDLAIWCRRCTATTCLTDSD